MLLVNNLKVSVGDKAIIKGVSFGLKKGEVLAIMGPNGSGKSTLAAALMGFPKYDTEGSILFNSEEIIGLTPDERARKGMFLSFQNPPEIEGLTLNNLLKSALRNKGFDRLAINEMINAQSNALGLKNFLARGVNYKLSGGEKKKTELLQMILLNPQLAILDEIDSGLDIDSLKEICKVINEYRKGKSLIIITHYKRILEHIKPDKVIIMKDGIIEKEGGSALADIIEERGFKDYDLLNRNKY